MAPGPQPTSRLGCPSPHCFHPFSTIPTHRCTTHNYTLFVTLYTHYKEGDMHNGGNLQKLGVNGMFYKWTNVGVQ